MEKVFFLFFFSRGAAEKKETKPSVAMRAEKTNLIKHQQRTNTHTASGELIVTGGN